MKLDPKKFVKDPVYFVENAIEKPLGHKLVAYQKDWIRLAAKHRRLCVMAFRTSGKTSQFLENTFIYHAVTRPGTKYAIFSKTLPQAREILKEIKTKILMSPILQCMIPKNRSQAWSASEIELNNHSRILARAANENSRGLHLHGAGTDELGEWEDHNILKKAVMPTLRAHRGFFVGMGTPKNEMDMLHSIERDAGFKAYHFDRFPAENDELGNGKGNLFEQRFPGMKIVHEKDGTVLIKDRKTGEVFDSYDSMTWSQEFMLRPLSTKDKLFPFELIKQCIDYDLEFTYSPQVMKQYFMGVDFAMSAESGSDYTVITVLEKGLGSNKFKIVEIERFKGRDYKLQKEKIKELADKYQVIKVLGDEGSFGKTFIYDLKAMGVPIQGYKFTHQSGSKEEMIKALRDQFDKKGFIIPFSDKDHKTKFLIKEMIEELDKFGIVFDEKNHVVKFMGVGKHDDMVTSLGLATMIARHISMGVFSAVKGKKTSQNRNIIAVSR